MKNFITLVLLLSAFNLVAQNYKFGKVSKEELQEKFNPADSTASATYLFKKRNTEYKLNSDGWQIMTTCHERIKIYNKEAFNYATKIISVYDPEASVSSSDQVNGIKGYTFNLENGKVVKEKLSSKNIFKVRKNKYRLDRKVTMPSIKVGSIIELKYTIVSPRTSSVDDVKFQYAIPVKKFDARVEIPEFFIYKKKNTGYFMVPMKIDGRTRVLSENETYNTEILNFEGENIPALKDDEPYVGSIRAYRGGMSFELTQVNFLRFGGDIKNFSNSWSAVGRQINEFSSFGGELKRQNYYKEDLNKLLVNAKTDSEKLYLIFNFVKSKVKWNGFYGFSAEKGVRKAYKEQSGNVGDINLMLTSMLNYAGLNASPVLVSSKGNGVPLFPTIDGFDYVITAVDFPNNSYVLLDATEMYSTPTTLPRRVLNWNGRKIAKNGASSWVSLKSRKPAIEENIVMVKIKDDLMVEGMYRTKFMNLTALTFRKNTNHLKEEGIIKALEENNNIEIDNFNIINKNKLSKPITRNVKFLSEDLVEDINGKLYIEPLLFLSHHENPFKLEERKFPVDFTTPWKDKHMVTIEIPEGYKVASIPESMAIGLPDDLGVFKFVIKQEGNKIKTTCMVEMNQPQVNVQYYAALKDFYGQRIQKESEKIVLVKI
ncbi:DUF3857 domain-containing protein [uncultured Polaribacter sp.]|uniref:DUF3857 domain-containing protein n=1 Tax=uncultured Polaribacter sp. TaxID=174711 RepID=UPI00262FB1A3|nr:DUF3857 domain-containing protein [uncultured Polaribacter sp.]